MLNGAQLDKELAVLHTAYDQAKKEVKETEQRLREVNRSLRLLGQYYRTRKTYQAYRRSNSKKGFREEHRSELELYDSAVKELRSIYRDGKFPPMQELKTEKSKLTEEKSAQYERYHEIRKQWMEVAKIVHNRDSFLKKQRNQERTESAKM